MKNKRIVIIGDSLSMPRPDEGVEYRDTYPYKLLEKGYETICRSRRANDTKIQSQEQNILDDIIFLNPRILIIHLGIVDCAPRLFTRTESRIISLFPKNIKNLIIDFFSNRRMFFTKLRNISYVDSKSYIFNIEQIINRVNENVHKIIIIKINKTNDINNLKSFNFDKKIEEYNILLDSLYNKLKNKISIEIIDPNNCPDGLLIDGIHINKKMHEFLYKEIEKNMDI